MGELSHTIQKDIDKPWFPAWAEQQSISTEGNGGSTGNSQAAAEVSARRNALPPPSSDRDSEQMKRCTVFVGRLGQQTDSPGLERFFGRYGKILEADVKMDDKTGNSKGFGFVKFAKPFMVDGCLAASRDHIMDGRRVDVKRYGSDSSASSFVEREE